MGLFVCIGGDTEESGSRPSRNSPRACLNWGADQIQFDWYKPILNFLDLSSTLWWSWVLRGLAEGRRPRSWVTYGKP
jgi:hypothetical protein